MTTRVGSILCMRATRAPVHLNSTRSSNNVCWRLRRSPSFSRRSHLLQFLRQCSHCVFNKTGNCSPNMPSKTANCHLTRSNAVSSTRRCRSRTAHITCTLSYTYITTDSEHPVTHSAHPARDADECVKDKHPAMSDMRRVQHDTTEIQEQQHRGCRVPVRAHVHCLHTHHATAQKCRRHPR